MNHRHGRSPGSSGRWSPRAGHVTAKITGYDRLSQVAAGCVERRFMGRLDPGVPAAFSDDQAVNSAPGTLDVSAEFPAGANDHVKRGVSENATNLGFTTKAWE